jgi:hypothetical protein
MVITVLVQITFMSSCKKIGSHLKIFILKKLNHNLSFYKVANLIYVFCNIQLWDKFYDLDYELVKWSNNDGSEKED